MLRIYLCALKNKIYLEEALVCIESLRTNGQFKGIIYLFTDMDIYLDDVEIIKVKCESVPLSAGFRLRVFDYISEYDHNDVFLYLDTDIVALKPIPSFEYIGDKIQLYGYSDRSQTYGSFAGFIVNNTSDKKKIKDLKGQSHKVRKIPGMCSGILLFRPSDKVFSVFKKTCKLYSKLIKKNRINCCWEQPALNYILIKHDMYEISLSDYVFEERTLPFKSITDLHVFNHFCGGREPDRSSRMKKYLRKNSNVNQEDTHCDSDKT